MKNNKLKMQVPLIMVSLLGLVSNANCQSTGFGYGAMIGVGQSNMKVNTISGISPKVNFTGGVASSYKFNKILGVNLDILATSRGANISGEEYGGALNGYQRYEEKFTFVDLDVPAQLNLCLGNDRIYLDILSGIGMNFNIFANSSRQFDKDNYNQNNGYNQRALKGINPTHLNWLLGIGLKAKSRDGNYYFAQFRMSNPLSEFGKIYNNTAYHTSYNLVFGYLFY